MAPSLAIQQQHMEAIIQDAWAKKTSKISVVVVGGSFFKSEILKKAF